MALSSADRASVCQAWLELLRVAAELEVLGFKRLLTAIERESTGAREPIDPDGVTDVRTHAYWLDIASRHHIVRAECLPKSLALHRWARCNGWNSIFRIGVRKADGELVAHAWVELEGLVVNDAPEAVAVFRPLRSLNVRG